MLSGVCVRTFVTSLIVGQYDTMSGGGGGVDGPHLTWLLGVSNKLHMQYKF